MKKQYKIFSIVILLIFVFTLSGCGKTSNDVDKEADKTTVTCTKTGQATTGVEADLTYQYVEKDGYVESIHTTEKLTSDNEEYLQAYKSLLDDSYEAYKDIEYYDYKIEIKGDTLISDININYAKIDTDRLIEIDSSNASLIKDGKVAAADLKTLYESIGATCK